MLSDGVSLVGLVNGAQTQILADVTSSSKAFVTRDPLFGAAIDELRLVGASQHDTNLAESVERRGCSFEIGGQAGAVVMLEHARDLRGQHASQ
jgi:hypothetical protein